MFIEIAKSFFSELETSIVHLLTNTESSMIELLEHIEFLLSQTQMKLFSEMSNLFLDENLQKNAYNLKIEAENLSKQEKNKLQLMKMRKLLSKKIKKLIYLALFILFPLVLKRK